MDTKSKLLIVGGNGFVGSTLTKAFAKKFQVYSTYHRSYSPVQGATHLALPLLTEKDRCDRLIQGLQPDVVIYCLGSNQESDAEKDWKATLNIHSNWTNHLVFASDVIKAKFIYLSSDCVFSGINGNFGESDSPVPFSQLGKAKAGAENMIKMRSLNHLIVRCAPLLGRGTLDHPSWLDKIREKIVHGNSVKMPSHYLQNPVHISFLVEVLERAIEMDLKNKTLHVGGLTRLSSFDLAKRFAEKIGLPSDKIECSDAHAVADPIDYTLNFTETLKSVEAQPLLLEQSFDLF